MNDEGKLTIKLSLSISVIVNEIGCGVDPTQTLKVLLPINVGIALVYVEDIERVGFRLDCDIGLELITFMFVEWLAKPKKVFVPKSELFVILAFEQLFELTRYKSYFVPVMVGFRFAPLEMLTPVDKAVPSWTTQKIYPAGRVAFVKLIEPASALTARLNNPIVTKDPNRIAKTERKVISLVRRDIIKAGMAALQNNLGYLARITTLLYEVLLYEVSIKPFTRE